MVHPRYFGCFNPTPTAAAVDDGLSLLARVLRRERVWISRVTLDGCPALRACICSHRTAESVIEVLVEVMDSAVAGG